MMPKTDEPENVDDVEPTEKVTVEYFHDFNPLNLITIDNIHNADSTKTGTVDNFHESDLRKINSVDFHDVILTALPHSCSSHLSRAHILFPIILIHRAHVWCEEAR